MIIMILDSLRNAKRYEALHKGFSTAFAFLNRYPQEGLPDGRYEIDGERIYAMVDRYTTSEAETLQLETHRKYIDIQFISRGKESFGWRDASFMDAIYDSARDISFYTLQPTTFVTPGEGEFVIFFPNDAHMPRVAAVEGPRYVERIVVKVLV